MFRLQGEILLLSVVFADVTTRSLTGVYDEFTELFEMTDFGIDFAERPIDWPAIAPIVVW